MPTVQRDYELMALWISTHTEPNSSERQSCFKLACAVAENSDRLRGNQKLFKAEKFIRRIQEHDQEREDKSRTIDVEPPWPADYNL